MLLVSIECHCLVPGHYCYVVIGLQFINKEQAKLNSLFWNVCCALEFIVGLVQGTVVIVAGFDYEGVGKKILNYSVHVTATVLQESFQIFNKLYLIIKITFSFHLFTCYYSGFATNKSCIG